jgi:hypothetical protein
MVLDDLSESERKAIEEALAKLDPYLNLAKVVLTSEVVE